MAAAQPQLSSRGGMLVLPCPVTRQNVALGTGEQGGGQSWGPTGSCTPPPKAWKGQVRVLTFCDSV